MLTMRAVTSAEASRIECVVDLQERDLVEVIPLFPKSQQWWILPVTALGLAFARGAVYGDVAKPVALTIFAIGSTALHFWNSVRWPQRFVAVHAGTPIRCQFDEIGFGVESKLGQARLPWTGAMEADELAGCFVVFTDPRNVLVVPKRVLSPEQVTALGALLRAHVTQRLNRGRGLVVSVGLSMIYAFVMWRVMQALSHG